jgi:hypothetical protein
MLSANDMRMFPTMAVTIPIKDDQRWSWESPFEADTIFSNVDKAATRYNGGAVKRGGVAASKVEVEKYIAADGLLLVP